MDKSQKWIILIGVSIACFLVTVDFTIVSTVLPAIQRELTASLLQLQWVMNIFVLVVSMLMISMGRFGDIFGQRRLLLFGIILFGSSSLFAALAPNPTWLIICRAFQGAACAIIIPCSLAVIAKTFPAEQTGKAVGAWAAINSTGLAVGPVLGGIIVSILSWRYVFYINIPVVIASSFICWKYLPKEKSTHSIKEIDWIGLTLLIVGIATLITPVIQITDWGWHSVATLTLFSIAILSFIAFVIVENRAKNPIMKFNILANSKFISGAIANFCLVAIIWIMFFLLPLYLHNIRNETAFIVGLMLLAISASVVIFSPLAGNIVDKVGSKKPITLGISLLFAAAIEFSFFTPSTHVWYVIIFFIALGIGWAFVMGPSASMAVTSVPEEHAGLSSGALWSIQNVGGALGLAIAGAIFRFREHIQLANTLQQQHISLTSHQKTLVHSLLSNPTSVQQALQKLSNTQHHKMMTLFKGSFISGFSTTMWFVVGMTLLALTLISIILRNR